MIVVRFRMTCRPEKAEEVMALLRDVVGPSREVAGVVSFDIARDVVDHNVFVATEVFEDRAALDRQESLPQVEAAMAAFEEALGEPPSAEIFHVSSVEPYGE